MFVGRFRHADNVGLSDDSFLVGNDRLRLDDRAVSVIFFEILEANFDVELSATSNNMLTSRFFSGADNEWVRLREFLKTINEFWEITGVLDGNCDSNDWRDGIFHGSDGVSIGVISDGTSLEDKLIDTNETDSVTTRNVWNVFSGSSLHNEGSLEGLFMAVILLSWDIVRSKDSNLLRSSNSSGEDSTESNESTFIGGRNHLGDVHHKGSLGVTSSHRLSNDIILRTFVEIRSSVLLSLTGGREMENHHF